MSYILISPVTFFSIRNAAQKILEQKPLVMLHSLADSSFYSCPLYCGYTFDLYHSSVSCILFVAMDSYWMRISRRAVVKSGLVMSISMWTCCCCKYSRSSRSSWERDGKVFKPIKSDLGQGWVSLKWNEATLENVDIQIHTSGMERITWFLHVLFIWYTGMAESLKAPAFICNKLSIHSENRTFPAMAQIFWNRFSLLPQISLQFRTVLLYHFAIACMKVVSQSGGEWWPLIIPSKALKIWADLWPLGFILDYWDSLLPAFNTRLSFSFLTNHPANFISHCNNQKKREILLKDWIQEFTAYEVFQRAIFKRFPQRNLGQNLQRKCFSYACNVSISFPQYIYCSIVFMFAHFKKYLYSTLL